MPERVLPNDLSGLEIRKAACDKLDQILAKDCHLQDTKAYGSFSMKVKWELSAEDNGRTISNEGQIEVSNGEVPEDADKYLGEFEIEDAPPNQVRIETGQEVPVLTRDGSGKPAIKGIKYGRPKADKGNNG